MGKYDLTPSSTFKAAATPKINWTGGSGNNSIDYLAKLMAKGEYDDQQRKKQEADIPTQLDKLKSYFKGKIPSGLNIKAGNISFEPNPKLDTEER